MLPETIQELGRFSLASTGITELTVTNSLTAIDPLALDSRVILYGPSSCYARSWAAENGRIFISSDAVLAEDITLSQDELTLLRGDRLNLEPTLTPVTADASVLRFFSTNERVVRVDESGTLYAIGGGHATIFITAPGGAETRCYVTVEVLPENFMLSITGRHICSAGDNFLVGAEFEPRKVTNQEVVYSSSNPDVAEITEDGTVTALKEGVSFITACPTANEALARSFLLFCDLPEASQLPSALTALDEEAMSGSAFEYILFPDTVNAVGDCAFADSPNLCVVEFTEADLALGDDVFVNCPNLTILAPAGGVIEEYATQHGIPFISTDSVT